MPLIHNKNLKTYFSIGEVAKMFDVSESLLRFWESEFPSIQPQKGLRNIRQYTAETIDEINIVYNLVKVRGMKISAARELIEKNHDKWIKKWKEMNKPVKKESDKKGKKGHGKKNNKKRR